MLRDAYADMQAYQDGTQWWVKQRGEGVPVDSKTDQAALAPPGPPLGPSPGPARQPTNDK